MRLRLPPRSGRPKRRARAGNRRRHVYLAGTVGPMRFLPVIGLVLLALVPASAAAAPPAPFGHACAPKDGVRFCPTATLADRVASFDGVPLDVDVTLPPTGDGPFPTIVMLHGLGQSKTTFEAADEAGTGADGKPAVQRFHYNNNFYAKRGYAVVNLSERG